MVRLSTLVAALAVLLSAYAPRLAEARPAKRYDVAMKDADARAIAKRWSEVTGRNVIVSSTIGAGKATVLAPKPLTRREADRVLRGALGQLDLVLLRAGRFWRVVPMRDAKEKALPVYELPSR